MRTARRIVSALMATALLAGASACGDGNGPVTAAPAPNADQTPTSVATAPAGNPDSQTTPATTTTTVITTTPPRPAVSIPATFRTRSILSLNGATNAQRQRVADAMWDFRGGRFTFDSTNVAANLYPLVGTYSVSGSQVSFRASGSFSAGTATSMTARVEGTLNLMTAEVSFLVQSNAFGAAVINGRPAGGGSSSAVQGTVRVKTGAKIPPHYTGPEPGSYSVTIKGTVNGISFSRSGTVYVAKSAGGNPIDVCLISGFPAGSPQVGAIRFVSNTVCFPGSSNTFDMGRATISGSTITVKADPMMASTGMSQFTASNSILACLFSVQSGSMKVTVANGRASGSIDVSSASCGGGRFQATIS